MPTMCSLQCSCSQCDRAPWSNKTFTILNGALRRRVWCSACCVITCCCCCAAAACIATVSVCLCCVHCWLRRRSLPVMLMCSQPDAVLQAPRSAHAVVAVPLPALAGQRACIVRTASSARSICIVTVAALQRRWSFLVAVFGPSSQPDMSKSKSTYFVVICRFISQTLLLMWLRLWLPLLEWCQLRIDIWALQWETVTDSCARW